MRIVLIVPTFPKVSETFIAAKAVGLLGRGLDVHVVCGSSPPDAWEAFGPDHPVAALRDRVHITAPSVRSGRPGRALAHHASALARIAPAHRRRHLDGGDRLPHRLLDLTRDADVLALDPDVIHVEFGSLADGLVERRERLGAAVTVSFRGYDLNYVGLEDPDRYRTVWEHADGIHVLGHDLWRRAIRRGAPPDLPHAVIPPAVDTTDLVPSAARSGVLGSDDRPLRLVSVGRLHWKKGIDHLLEATSRLAHAGLRIEHRVIGDGDQYEAAHWWRHQLDLDSAVTFLGSVAPDEVATHLGWADLFVHAATSEGFCNAVLEAQAHGIPVVTSDADGLAENVDHGTSGLVVARRDPAALAAAVAELAADPDRRTSMATAAAARVRERFRLDDQLDAWIEFYERAVARRP
jgi:colanic acid/amylovoran biosynthesis glycosyltransferase